MPGALAGLLARFRTADPLNVYIAVTSAGIVWVVGLSRTFYANPVTDDKTTLWDTVSFSFILKWIKKYPIGGKPMLVADLPGDHRGLVTPFRDRFLASWKKSGGKTSGALLRWMAPWWLFTHAINAPRKYVQFLPAFLVSNLLDFLENARVPVTVGYKLIALAALRAVCEKTAHLASHLSPNSAGVQPAFIGAKAAIYTKLQTMSPRGRVTISAAEVQTVFSKMDSGKWSWFGGTMDVGLEVASLPLGYYFFYKLFGLPAVLVSITTNFGLTAITAKVMARKTAADKRLRELRKKQEDALNELAGSLPIWKLYGWTGMFIGRLETLTEELQAAGRVAAVWKALGEVLPLCIGPAAVLISVGIDVRLGGKVSLVKLLTAGQYIQIISASMTALQRTVAQWKEFVIEAKSIDDILLLPDAEPLQRSADGTIRLSQASFGWPVKPPQRYEVTAKGDTPCVPAAASKANADAAVASKANADAADAADADADADVDADANANANANGAEATESEGDLVPSTLQAGDVVESVDDQKTDTTVRVRSVGGKHNGYVELSALKKLPPPKHADWAAPKAVVAELDVEITPGELVLVSGPVAGGKSSFLQSLVGNTEQLSGELTVPHSVAFQPQTPILFDQTIRSNILFGVSEEDANEDWIKESLDSSTLSMDMDDSESTLHAKREMTKAGQNGSELSGGQQARVALARCFYAALAGSECVILDDPIKALDPATAARCWESGIKGTLARKTRVLVVNSQMLQRFATDAAVTRLIIVESGAEGVGKIAFNGSPSEMPKSLAERLGDGYNIDFSEQAVAAQLAKDLAAAPESEEKAAVEASPEMLAAAEAVKAKVLTVKTWPDVYQGWFKGCLHKGDDGIKQIAMGVSKDLKEFAGKDDEFKQAVWKMLIKGDFGDLANQQFPEINGPAEEAAKSEDDTKDEEDKPPEPEPKKNYPHTIPGSILDYCKRQGIFVPITCGCSFVSQALALIVYYWNDKWATDAYKLGFRRNYGIAIGLTLASQLVQLGSKMGYGFGSEAASKTIRKDINKKLSVLAMPYLWDPKNSTAALSDLVTRNPQEFEAFAWMPLIVSAGSLSLGAIVFSQPLLTPVAIACLWLYKYVKKPFGWAIRQIYGGLFFESNIKIRKLSGEIFDSSPTIRAMGREPEFQLLTNDNFYRELQIGPLFMSAWGRTNFYAMVVDSLWATVSMAVVITTRGKMPAPVAIAVYNQLEKLNMHVGNLLSVNDVCAQALPNYMKIQDFLVVTECRGKSCIEEDLRAAPVGWPGDGTVSMEDVVFHYASDAPSALSGVSISIKSGEKIGVCGRTGAGKSTLLSILFSLGPLTEGEVQIAGHNLAEISCHEVRARLAIVPQSPTLFAGTVRENLLGGNRASDHSDDFLLSTLRTCRLGVLVDRGLEGTLGVLSDGQKQLFSVARALVRKPKILVLDEATADLDQDSANELLRVIDESFAEITVISIAHRLNFIRNSDRILVLNAGGTVNAFDTPEKLLEDKEGYFSKQFAEENRTMA